MQSDFFTLTTKVKGGQIEVYPSFKIKSKDIIAKGGNFYAVYNHETKLWSTDEEDVVNMVDDSIMDYLKDNIRVTGALLNDSESGSWQQYKKFISTKPNMNVQFDRKFIYKSDEICREDYATRRLSYDPKEGSTKAFNKILGTLYGEQEIEKIKWFIGCLMSGESNKIQKFAVFFGPPGSGKSTVINIIEMLAESYSATFEAKALVSSTNQFGTAAFKDNPLLAIQHDGDLSRIEDNSILNSLVSHETIILNEKYKTGSQFTFNGLIILGSNKAVKITDSKSGMLRRILDIIPSGVKIPYEEYINLTEKVKFEVPHIVFECIKTYKEMGNSYYNDYKPFKMSELTDFFYDFVLENLSILKGGITLRHATELYIKYCEDNRLDVKAARQKVRLQLDDYFKDFSPKHRIGDIEHRDYYYNFDESKIVAQKYEPKNSYTMRMDSTNSYLNAYCSNCLAQTTNEKGLPLQKWSDVKTKLDNINTSDLHFMKPNNPNHIVIDFDLKDENGKKSPVKNIKAASKFPKTYGEFSQSGGVHLHYIYDGDIEELSNIYSDDIEIKIFKGKASLRRKFTYSNGINTIATISSGLPLKERKVEVIDKEIFMNEQTIRKHIMDCLQKKHHGSTAPEIDFIYKILTDAKNADVKYDITDLRPTVQSFAMSSTNQASKCLEVFMKMPFENQIEEEILETMNSLNQLDKEDITFFDIEVVPNLFLVVIKPYGKECMRFYNPTPQEIDVILRRHLVGFYCRNYDNHMLYAALNGYNNEQLYNLSQRIIDGSPNSKFMNAYNLSYADLYEYSSDKKSLKKWEIELDITHDECEFPWDEPLPEEHWERLGDYCCNDVIATEAVFEERMADYTARLIISELSGLPVNAKTQSHAATIIFEGNKKPQSEFIYTDLSEEFPGYKYEYGVSTYNDRKIGEGGLADSIPGIYSDGLVGLMDIESQHPTSGGILNMFGKYTKNYVGLKDIRLSIKHGNLDEAKRLGRVVFGTNKLDKYLQDKGEAKKLSYALKIIINIVYGMSSAGYENPFKDPRNVDNIMAKRGALLMASLDEYVNNNYPEYQIIHIKTDSVKVYPFDEKIEAVIKEYGRNYGYTFVTEAVYDKFGLLDKAQYWARYADHPINIENSGPDCIGKYTSTGTIPSNTIIFKTLCDQEDPYRIPKDVSIVAESKKGPIYIGDRFVGKNAHVVPINTNAGRELMVLRDGKEHAVQGTKGYKFMLYSDFINYGYGAQEVDWRYFDTQVKDALHKVVKVGDPWSLFDFNKIPHKFRLEEFIFNDETEVA